MNIQYNISVQTFFHFTSRKRIESADIYRKKDSMHPDRMDRRKNLITMIIVIVLIVFAILTLMPFIVIADSCKKCKGHIVLLFQNWKLSLYIYFLRQLNVCMKLNSNMANSYCSVFHNDCRTVCPILIYLKYSVRPNYLNTRKPSLCWETKHEFTHIFNYLNIRWKCWTLEIADFKMWEKILPNVQFGVMNSGLDISKELVPIMTETT